MKICKRCGEKFDRRTEWQSAARTNPAHYAYCGDCLGEVRKMESGER